MSGFFTRIRNFLETIFGKTDEPIEPERKDSQDGLTFEKDNEHAAEEERLRLEEEAKQRAAEEERLRLEEEAKERAAEEERLRLEEEAKEREVEEERLRLEKEAKQRAAEEERLRLEKEANERAEEEAKEQEKSQEKSELDNDDFQDVIVDDEKLAETVEPELIEGISERRKSIEKEAKLRLEDIEDE